MVTSRSGRALKANRRFQSPNGSLTITKSATSSNGYGSFGSIRVRPAVVPAAGKRRLAPHELEALKSKFARALPKSRAMTSDVLR